MADSNVIGKLSSADLKVDVTARVSCNNSKPAGVLWGQAEFFDQNGSLKKYTFAADTNVMALTYKFPTFNSLEAVFGNVTLQDDNLDLVISNNCSAFLTATQIKQGVWSGVLGIVCPEGKRMLFVGDYSGSVTVNRQIYCTISS